ncbi:holo-ACP synthase [Mucilaginibacter sp. KACC 22063]|uniref:holo-ACP synthase n=1 Tax=Mucilaginibacter sp. KACC 22063 TaxID=3025666 RepID=UPI0023672D8B|nr:holo-ACP synthase [Mucilaginibacter sp. KACC 22063]WDF55483.1 holo-ACP synthase [Mucilaginibacter sp. KACC 22063]
MITGLGTDIVEVDRMEQSILRANGFREMVFSAHEIQYCERMANKYEHYAARFAAKEAFFKALGTGWKSGTSFNEIEVFNDANGKPEIRLLGQSAEAVGPVRILVSLTHVQSMAAATVIIEK